MDPETIRALLPLGRGKLRDFRKDIRRQAVLSVAARRGQGSVITPIDVQGDIQEQFKFALPLEVVANECHRLAEEGILRHREDGGHFEVAELPDFRGYEHLIYDMKMGFGAFLRENRVEFDSSIDREVEARLVHSAEALLDQLVAALERGDATGWSSSSAHVRAAIIAPWTNIPPKQKRAAVLFEQYIQTDRVEVNRFVLAVFETAVTVDLFRRGRALEEVLKSAGKPTRLYLDTNTLSALLCKSNKYHEVVKAGVSIARRFGFEVGYISDTRAELDRIIKSAAREVRDGNAAQAARWNEFVLEYARSPRGTKWGDVHARLARWADWVKDDYEIMHFEIGQGSLPDDTRRLFAAAYQGSLRYAREHRDADVMNHDFQLYSAVSLAKTNEERLFDAPLALTLDRFLCSTDSYLSDQEELPACIIHATAWLEFTSQFLDAEFGDATSISVARAVLVNLIKPSDSSLTIAEYAKLLAAKEDWEPARIEVVARILVESVQRGELEEALKKGDMEKAGQRAQEALANTGLVREIVGREFAEKEAADLRERLGNLRVELESQKLISRMLQEALSRPIAVSVTIEGVSPQAVGMLDQLKEEILRKVPELAADAGVDVLDIRALTSETFRTAVKKIEGSLKAAAPALVQAQSLLLVAQRIWSLLPHS